MTRVLTIGTFDPPHIGHANLFRQARQFGDHLTIGVNSDLFVATYKGVRPVFSEVERYDLVEHFADDVWLNETPGRELILHIDPDVLVVGSDWAPPADYASQIGVSAAELADWGITLVFVPRTPGISSTDLKSRLQ